MRPFIFIAAILLACQFASAADLSVQVGTIKTQQGQVWVSVFKSADTYLKASIQRTAVKADAAELRIAFKDLEPGDYAVTVHHDVNDNGKMDRNFIGMPSEPYGFSNNAMGSMGPPSFDQAKVKVPAEGRSIQIKLK
jgi:uncharacterized protein (DUF2141 family)